MSMKRVMSSTLILSASVILTTAEAAAEECPEETSSPEEARRIAGGSFREGRRLFEAGDAGAALEHFQCAFRVAPHPNVLYNIGECKEALGDVEGALRTYQSYLELFPEGEGRSQAEERIRVLEAQLEASQQEPSEEPSPTPSPTPVEERAPRPEPDEPTRGPMTTARIMAFVSLALGACITGGGVGLEIGARSVNDDFNDRQQEEPLTVRRADLEALHERGEALEVSGWVLMGLGLATLATSVLLFVAFDGYEPGSMPGGPSAGGLRLGLSPVAQGGALSITGSF
jgi:tetratricopeptide (TPR) repeat protein